MGQSTLVGVQLYNSACLGLCIDIGYGTVMLVKRDWSGVNSTAPFRV